jgi:multicomponent K+:H+ antiporter subunit A
MSLALIAAMPFIGALLVALTARSGRNAVAAVALAANGLALLGLLLRAPAVLDGEVIIEQAQWLPALGLSASFRLDGLGLLFAGLILGMGLLINLYARFYLYKDEPAGLFHTYLMLFQGAMTGIVLSENILLLLVFWELTSLSSFLLIGWWRHLPEGRQGARMALVVTGGGGLALIGGMLILGNIAGSYELTDILAAGDAIRAHPMYLPALALILIGAFTKSAQFPFHFWLPHAMAAPTPVSAYLHSATMVKAGLFLLARLSPALAGTEAWIVTVTLTGAVTMLLGAVIANFKDDLKAVLAFSTVSHLGLITMLLGMSTQAAAVAAVFHIICHATFKAALFMQAGIIDHAAHTRSIARLGGLRRAMPLTFVLTTVAALSMAGIPPLNGFLSKEMMLEEAVHETLLGLPWLVPLIAAVAAAFSVGYSFRLIAQVFLGAPRDPSVHAHDPGPGLWAGPALLVMLVIGIGLFPMGLAAPLVDAAAGAVAGEPVQAKIKMWHGLNAALFISIFATGAGLVLLGLHAALQARWDGSPRPEGKAIFDATVGRVVVTARRLTDGLHDGRMARTMGLAVAAIVAVATAAFLTGDHGPGQRTLTPMPAVAVVGWGLACVATLVLFRVHRDRLLALVIVAVVGLVLSAGFALMSAPDLALTQIAVEVVTVILMLLSLVFLPKQTPADLTQPRQTFNLAVAAVAGMAVAALAFALMMRDAAFDPISLWHLANAKPGGGGTNAVNVIIVDFRGFDTYGEIIVLGIAALVIFAMTEALLRPGPANERLLSWRPDIPEAGDRHPLVLAVGARLILPIALVIAVYIFLRGHNQPGGGFVAGLIVAIALLVQYMASGFGWAQARLKVDYHALIGAGVVIAGLTGMGAWANGLPFLTSAFGYFDVWPVGEFELATAALFDLGVFLTVLGAVMLALASLSRIAVRAGETQNVRAYGIDPAKEG